VAAVLYLTIDIDSGCKEDLSNTCDWKAPTTTEVTVLRITVPCTTNDAVHVGPCVWCTAVELQTAVVRVVPLVDTLVGRTRKKKKKKKKKKTRNRVDLQLPPHGRA